MRMWMMLAVAMISVVLLCGCMAVRAPVLLAVALDNSPVPKGGKVVGVEVQPMLRSMPIARTSRCGDPAQAVVRVRASGSPEEVLKLYRAELKKRGWREKLDEEKLPPAQLGGAYVFMRGGDKEGWDMAPTFSMKVEELTVELRDGVDGAVKEVRVTLKAVYPIDCPGRALARQNSYCSEMPYMAFGSSTAADIFALPEALVIAAFF